jgi:hypothetical protein
MAGANTGTGDKTTVNKSSVNTGGAGRIASPANAKNLVKGGSEAAPDGTSPKKPSNYGTKGEGKLPGADKFENRPGARAGDTFGNAKKPTNSEAGGTNDKSPLAKK